MFAKELEERARRQELRRRASINSLTPKKNINTVVDANVKNTSKKLEEPLDADSNDVLDLLDSDSGSGQEDEEDDVDADSIFLRMGEENADDSDAEEEKTLKDKLEDATTTPSPSGKQSHESAKDLPELPPRAVDESPGSYQDKLLRHEQVGAINAQQLSRARSTTTQYDPQQQLAIEFIRRREQACAWIKSIMDQRSSSRREKETLPTQETFVKALKNGVILCEDDERYYWH